MDTVTSYYHPRSFVHINHKKRKFMRISFLPFTIILFLSIALQGYSQVQYVYRDPPFVAALLQQQNTYRSSLRLPALNWSEDLAKDALVWARHLAAIDK